MVPKAGFPIELIEVRGLKGKGLADTLRNLMLLPLALWQSFQILRRWRPDIVVGRGRVRERPGGARRVAPAHPDRGAGAERDRGPHEPRPRTGRAGRLHRLPGGRPPLPAPQGVPARQPHPPHADGELHAAGGCGTTRRACSSSAAPRAPTPSTCGWSRRSRTSPISATGCASRTRPARATATRSRTGYRACGFEPDVREFITDMSAAYAGADLDRMPRGRDDARGADRLPQAVHPRPVPVRRRQPPGAEREAASWTRARRS